MEQVETEGLVLSCYPYKENDQLIKIFTEKYGKVMFLVKGAARPNFRYRTALQPLVKATYIARIREDGLSFINGVRQEQAFLHLQHHYDWRVYGLYMLNVVDLALEDYEADPLVYGLLSQGLELMDKGYDASIIAAIFAVQMLSRFGIRPQFEHCTLCGETSSRIPYDFCEQTGGIVCARHFETLPYRYHATPRAIYFLRQFQHVSFEWLDKINVTQETKDEIWQCIDQLYDSYVGVRVKSREYIKKMQASTLDASALLKNRRIDKT